MVSSVRTVAIAAGATKAVWLVAPGTAAKDTAFARFWSDRIGASGKVIGVLGVLVGAPFPYIAVHVVQAPDIGFLLSDGMRRATGVVRHPGKIR